MYNGGSDLQQLRRRKGSESESNFPVVFPSVSQGHNPFDASSSSAAASSSFSLGTMPSLNPLRSSHASRDRTQEFAATVRSLESGNQNFKHHRQQGQRLAMASAEFMTIAKSIGKDIANTYTKLEKLTLLAKRKTIFDDRPQEIQELTFIIKEDMNCLNRQIGQLQKIAKTQQHSPEKRGHQATHSSSVVVALQSKLASMTSDFKNVLQVRTENLKESRSRELQFSQDRMTTSMPQSAMNGYHSGSLLAAMEDDEMAASRDQKQRKDVAISMDSMQVMQRRQQHDTESHLQQRADTMQSIESTIVELGGIFQQLAHMIKEQEETMLRIDNNVEDTALQVEGGHAEILKYFQSVTSNRWLMVKIFGVLIFFFIFFVIFMA